MRVPVCLGAVLLVVSSASAGQAPASSPSLQDAERAFTEALLRHDRSAFVAAFAPDAESSLPSVKRGPEAIASSWLPFLIDPGTTMVLTSSRVTTAPSGDVGDSTGTFAIRGRTSNGIQTIPAGTYSIGWRLLDGHWKITTLGGSGKAPGKPAARGGVGHFLFGMTRTEVSQVPDCQPYTPVSATGGLECPHYSFEGHEMNVSFLFNADRLRRVQLWFYEGASEVDAKQAVGRVLDYLQRTAGSVTLKASPGTVTADRVMELLQRAPVQPGSLAHVEILTPSGTRPETWFSRVGRHQGGYMVMLFADGANEP
jgi:ketosteroid isomerase-like protein